MDNMAIYNQARTVPDEAIKEIKAGRLKGMSDINPMWRIKRLTEIFGPCGVGWWYTIKDERIVDDAATKQRAAFVDIDLYYVFEGKVSMPIPGTGGASFLSQERNGPYLSDECFKMALTDAISVAAKALGIGADVYYAKDRDKYSDNTEPRQPKPKGQTPETPKPESAEPVYCADCGAEIQEYVDGNGKKVGIAKWVDASNKRFGRALCTQCADRQMKMEALRQYPEVTYNEGSTSHAH